LRDGAFNVHFEGLVAFVGEVDGFDMVPTTSGNREQAADPQHPNHDPRHATQIHCEFTLLSPSSRDDHPDLHWLARHARRAKTAASVDAPTATRTVGKPKYHAGFAPSHDARSRSKSRQAYADGTGEVKPDRPVKPR